MAGRVYVFNCYIESVNRNQSVLVSTRGVAFGTFSNARGVGSQRTRSAGIWPPKRPSGKS